MARLYKKYKEELRDKLRDKFKYKSIMQVPKIEKIVLNMGVGRASQDKSLLDEAIRDLKLIAGQAPVSTIAKRAEASFKLREGQAIGCKVTLRGPRMYEFLDRMISISLPAVKDFRGVPVKLDGRGNYSLGWKEHTLFPEVDLNKVKHNFGMDICITTTANTDEEGRELLAGLGMPFKKNN